MLKLKIIQYKLTGRRNMVPDFDFPKILILNTNRN